MSLAIKEGRNLEEKVTMLLTRREVLLLELYLKLVARDHARSGTACFDVERLRERLADESEQKR